MVHKIRLSMMLLKYFVPKGWQIYMITRFKSTVQAILLLKSWKVIAVNTKLYTSNISLVWQYI